MKPKKAKPKIDDSAREIAELKARLAEAEETLEAIRSGAVDALVVGGAEGDQVFALKGAETPYRLLVEAMHETALMVNADGTILYCNGRLAGMVQCAPGYPIGKALAEFVAPDQLDRLKHLLTAVPAEGRKGEFWLQSPEGGANPVPVQLAVRSLALDGSQALAVIATDLTSQKAYEGMLRQSKDELEERVRLRTAELRNQREYFRVTLTSIGDAVIASDTAGRATFLNPIAVTLTGWSEEQALGQPVAEVFRILDERTRHPGEDIVARVLLQKRIVNLANGMALITRDGREIPIEDSAAPIFDSAGNITGVVLVFHEVTEKRRAQEALRKVSERDAFLVSLADALRPLSDVDAIKSTASRILGQHLRASRVAYAEVTPGGNVIIESGYAEGVPHIPGRYRLEDFGPALLSQICSGRNTVVPDVLATPDYTEQEKAKYREVQVVANLNVPLLKGDRPVALLAVHQASPRHWTDEEVLLVQETVERTWSTVERARAEEKLHLSEQRFQLSMEATNDGLWDWDAKTDQVYYSPSYYRILGYEPAGFPPTLQAWKEMVHPDDLERTLKVNMDCVEGRSESFAIEYRMKARTGEWRWILGRGRCITRDQSGRATRLIGTHVEITERKQFEAELERLVAERTAKSQEMINELQHVSYSIVHDMRAPLRAMQGVTDLLEEECAGCARTVNLEHFRRIKTAAARMDRLITDALHYTKTVLEEVPLQSVNLSALLHGLLETYPNLHPNVAEISIEGGLPPVLGNEALLVQCFANLLANAVKFVAPGVKPRVRLWAESMENTETRGQEDTKPAVTFVRVWVADNGIGIPEIAQARLFGMFQRLAVGYEGTGIGLAIVRKVVERMGGTVGVESTEGQGSRFWVKLRTAP